MCFHNSMTKKAKQLANRYQRKLNFSESETECAENLYHISAFNNPLYPVITASSEIQLYRWGLIPFWVKTEEDAASIRTKTYNARAESIFDKPSFRSSVTSKRCLIPSTGWFDWRHEKGKKIPYFIYVKDEEIFSMAGIYSEWQHPQTRQTLYTFSIITTAANELMRCIHNTNFRMPVLLYKEEEEKWLYPELNRPAIEEFLQPFDSDRMEAYVIDNRFLQKSPYDPTVIKPLSPSS